MEIEQSKLPHIESSAHEKEFATPAWRHAEGFGGWAVTEKIDGCSLGIHVSTGAFRLSSRECMLEEGEDFYRILQLKDLYRPLVEAVQKALQGPCAAWRQITLHGEYFGPRIMGRIVYGKTRSIRLFGSCSIEPAEEAACSWSLRQWSFAELKTFLGSLGMEHWLVPVAAEYASLAEALAVPASGRP
ncbi:MAG: RNA ligase family protein [Desulfovibrio sp.]|nr:RNA ligase family protein [Desulfovibrio sp.]